MREFEADVAIVGGGASGLAVAITAAEGGAKVILLEKANTTGGCANMAMGLLGVEFALPSKYFPGSEATWHIVKPKTGNPGLRAVATMIKYMTERAEELGVTIMLETPVKKLIKDNGEIIGLEASDKDGALEVYAGAVVIATGGFGDNPDFIKKYTPYEWDKDILDRKSVV